MKIRLIEPEPPGMHVYAKVLLPRLGLPIIAATLKAARPRRAHLQLADGAHRLGRRAQRRPRRPLEHHVHGDDRLRVRRRAARPRHPGGHRRLARHVHGRRGPRRTRLRGPRRGRRADHARAHRGACAAPASWRRRRPVLQARRRGRAQPAARAAHRPRRAALPRPPAAGRQREAHDDAHHDELGLPLRLQLLFGHGDVRAQVPLPQRRERDRRDQGQAPDAHLLLRRQHGRRQEASQEAPADDDRREPRRSPGRRRCAPTWSATPSCSSSCSGPAASSSTSASSRSTRRRSTATRSRRPSTTSSKASGCCTSTASAATACSCSAPTPTTCRRSATP